MSHLGCGRWAATLVALLAAAASTAGAEELAGKITETGHGKFKLSDSAGVERLLLLSMKGTSYEPATWRPTVGDRVKVQASTVETRSGPGLAVDRATLVEAGPDTWMETSPIEVEIQERGRSGIKAKAVKSGKPVRFDAGRETVWEPTGWAPAAGERARVTFHTVPSRFGFTVVHVADRIEKK